MSNIIFVKQDDPFIQNFMTRFSINSPHCYRIPISSSVTGWFIGKGGENIRRVQEGFREVFSTGDDTRTLFLHLSVKDDFIYVVSSFDHVSRLVAEMLSMYEIVHEKTLTLTNTGYVLGQKWKNKRYIQNIVCTATMRLNGVLEPFCDVKMDGDSLIIRSTDLTAINVLESYFQWLDTKKVTYTPPSSEDIPNFTDDED